MDVERKRRGGLDPDVAIGLGPAPDAQLRCCAWPDCSAAGEYRAPTSPKELRSFIWLCLEHVREYNKSWNYFAGMDEREIEAHRRADTTWHRPTWRFAGAQLDPRSYFQDPFGFFARGEAGHADAGRGDRGPGREPTRAKGKTALMLEVLDLELGFTLDELKRRYKTLVKRHHPDLHGGDRDAEERLKQVNEAYTYLVANQLYR